MRNLVCISLAGVGLIIGAFAAQLTNASKGLSGTEDLAQQREDDPTRFVSDSDGNSEAEKTTERADFGFDEIDSFLEADFETLLGKLDPSDDAWVIYLARLVELDPFRTLEFLLEPQNESLRGIGFNAFCEAAVASDPERALEAVLGIEEESVLESLEYGLLYAFAAHHPKATLAILKDRSEPFALSMVAEARYSVLSISYQNLAVQDLEAVLEVDAQIDDPMESSMAIRCFVRAKHRSGDSYSETYNWANETFKESRRNTALWAVVDDALQLHVDEAVELLSTAEDFPRMQTYLEINVRSLGHADAEKVMALLQKKLSGNSYQYAIGTYMQSVSPKQVIEVYETYLTPELRELSEVKEAVLRGVSEMEPAKGFEWLDQNFPKGKLEPAALQRIVSAYAPLVPERLANFVIDRYSPEESVEVLESIIAVWAEKDPEASVEWIERSLSENTELRDRLTQWQLQIAVRRNPSAYASSLNAVPFTERHGKLARTVAHSWSAMDPQAAADWAATIGDRELAAVAIDAVSMNWVRYDRIKASEWISGLPEGEARKSAVRNLLKAIGKSDPEAAALWQKELDK